MTTVERAKAFAWDFYVNDTESYFGTPSHELYDAYINNELAFDDIVLNTHFEYWWEETFTHELKDLHLSILVLIAAEYLDFVKEAIGK